MSVNHVFCSVANANGCILLFCLSCKFVLESSISLQQDQFLLVTQAFVSPPDMASSGVWKNVILPKTLTFEGVSGILYYTIFLNVLPNFFGIFDRW